MRTAPICIIFSVLLCVAGGQVRADDHNKLLDTIDKPPDMSLVNPLQHKAYQGSGFLKVQPYISDKGQYSTKSALSKEFAGTRSFFGIKNPWSAGSKVYPTEKAALQTNGVIKNADRKFASKEHVVKSYSQATTSHVEQKPAYYTQAFVARGPEQGLLNQESDKLEKTLTIDDIRDLLNKNR